jgi:hypothetical protein
LAIYLISQAKTGMSALALKRYLGVSYPTAWLIQHKLMEAMSERETKYTLSGQVQIDDAYFGGELSGGKAGRGSENKVPFVAALSLDEEGHPLRVKLTPVSGFTNKAIADWAKANLSPGCAVLSDGLACFAAVTEAGCEHQAIIVGGRKPKDVPEFLWSTPYWEISRPAWVVLIMLLISQNTPCATWQRLLIASTVVSSSIRSRNVSSWRAP